MSEKHPAHETHKAHEAHGTHKAHDEAETHEKHGKHAKKAKPEVKPPFALHDGKLYVAVSAVMSPLAALADGIPVTDISGQDFMTVDQAITWCQEEKKFHSPTIYERYIAAMEKVKKEQHEEANPEDGGSSAAPV
jgi:hypothetical protein